MYDQLKWCSLKFSTGSDRAITVSDSKKSILLTKF